MLQNEGRDRVIESCLFLFFLGWSTGAREDETHYEIVSEDKYEPFKRYEFQPEREFYAEWTILTTYLGGESVAGYRAVASPNSSVRVFGAL